MSSNYYGDANMIGDDESGYASGESSHESLPEIVFSKAHLKFLNHQLAQLEPQGP
jgi:phosphoadenosine phosphosulfate reductase